MIPTLLTIEGLYSYQQRQSIDFTQLTNAGLFGIFGTVGSGKSSILEAITFALYGETERLNARDERSYNMMNLKSNRCFIEFEFINHENKTFKIQREYRRNSKNFTNINNSNTVFYEKKDNTWVPLDHCNAEKIIGISYKNFKRTIIIPQGKFRDFIELGNNDRTEMMKEIFNLDRFDLQENIKKLHTESQKEADTLEGQLENYKDTSEDNISEKKQILQNEKNTLKTIQNNYNIVNEYFEKLKILKTDFDILEKKEKKLQELIKQQDSIKEKEEKAKQYKIFKNDFEYILKKENETQNNIYKREKKLQEIKESIKKINIKKDENAAIIQNIEPLYKQFPEKNEEKEDLIKIDKIITDKQEVKNLEKRIEKGTKIIDDAKKERDNTKNEIKHIKEEIQNLKSKKVDAKTITEVGNWFQILKNKKENLYNREKNIENKRDEIKKIITLISNPKISLEELDKQFKIDELKISKQKEELENKKNNYEVHRKLSQYSENIKDGEPCPLCGSTEHPLVHSKKDSSKEIEQINESLQNIKTEIDKINEQYLKDKNLINNKKILENQISEELKSYQQIENEINSLYKNFHWEGFSMDNEELYERKKKESFESEKEISDRESILDGLEKKINKNEENIKKYEKNIDEIIQNRNIKNSNIENNISLLKRIKFHKYENHKSEDIHKEIHIIEIHIKKIEEEYLEVTENQKKIDVELIKERKSEELLNEELKNERENLQKVTEQINKNLSKHNIHDIEIIKNNLSQEINIEKYEEEISNFYINKESTEKIIFELKNKYPDTYFDHNEYDNKEKEWKEAKQNLENQKELVTKYNIELDNLEKKWKEKQSITHKYNAIKQRNENLNVLKTLFKGNAFVQYISHIFLKQLCENANIRFQKMTKNQLSINFNEKNNFEIIDYLNEGRTRSVKTLSGGQYFQVALCLALALAETVQAKSQSEQNFFFIDEGFGTLDSESVHTVFETLTNLRKENRVVGIISHVNELKEQIPATIQVIKTEDRGSIIIQE